MNQPIDDPKHGNPPPPPPSQQTQIDDTVTRQPPPKSHIIHFCPCRLQLPTKHDGMIEDPFQLFNLANAVLDANRKVPGIQTAHQSPRPPHLPNVACSITSAVP